MPIQKTSSNLPEDIQNDIFASDSWRVFRIISEFVEGFETLTKIGPSVSIFGSARIQPATPYYNLAVDTAEAITKKGFAIVTGGGPGIMQAANKGAQAAGGKSCGLAIDLPAEVATNQFIDEHYHLHFRYFFIRKVMFIRYAQGYVFLPGGYGTCDELFEALTLIQTEKIHGFPIYVMGKEYWKGLLEWMEKTMLKDACISPQDLKLIHVTDDPQEVADGIERHYQKSRAARNF